MDVTFLEGALSQEYTNYKDFKNNEGKVVTLKGMVHRIRRMSDFSFIIVRTGKEVVQCIYSLSDSEGYFDENLVENCSCRFTGLVVKDNSKEGRYELHIHKVEILSVPNEILPIVINKKELNISLDSAIALRPISLRNTRVRAIFALQAGFLAGYREFMISQNFIEINTPKIVSAGAEGGADIFSVDYFGRMAYLAQSPQFYKQIMVGVFERVFEVGHVYRAEKHDTNRHINEFIGLDYEMGFINSFYDIMDMETAMLKYVFNYLNNNYQEELNELKLTLPVFDKIPSVKFMDIKEIVAKKYKRKFAELYDLEPEEEKLIGKYAKEELGSELIFITHYPECKRPFYAMEDPMDRTYTLSFDLLLNGSEITTGGQRIHDYNMQVEKMIKLGMNPVNFSDYLMLHKYGVPPHGGLGIGLERLFMKLLNLPNIREASLFIRDINRLTP